MSLDGEPGDGQRRGWCVASCGCSLDVPPGGVVHVDCAACEPTQNPAGRRQGAAPPAGDRPGTGPEGGSVSGPADAAAAFEWLAFGRVYGGGVVALGGRYFDGTRPLGGEVATALDELSQVGCLALGRPRPDGRATVCVTVAGQVRYAQLQHGGGGDGETTGGTW